MVVGAADHAAKARRAGDRFRDRHGARLRVRADGDEAPPRVDVAEPDGVLAVDRARRRPWRDDAEAAAVALRREQRARVAAADANDVERVDVGRRHGAEVDFRGEPHVHGLGERGPPGLLGAPRSVEVEVDRVRVHGQRGGLDRGAPAACDRDHEGRRQAEHAGHAHVGGRLRRPGDRDRAVRGDDRRKRAREPRRALGADRRGECPPRAPSLRRLEVGATGGPPHRLERVELEQGRPLVVVGDRDRIRDDANAKEPVRRASALSEPRLQAEREQDADLRCGHLRCPRAGCRRGSGRAAAR